MRKLNAFIFKQQRKQSYHKIYFRLELLRSSFIPFFYGPTEQQNK